MRGDEEAADAAVAIAEGVDIFKFSVKIGDFGEIFTVICRWLVVIFDELVNEARDEIGVGTDVGADADPFVVVAEAAGETVVDAG